MASMYLRQVNILRKCYMVFWWFRSIPQNLKHNKLQFSNWWNIIISVYLWQLIHWWLAKCRNKLRYSFVWNSWYEVKMFQNITCSDSTIFQYFFLLAICNSNVTNVFSFYFEFPGLLIARYCCFDKKFLLAAIRAHCIQFQDYRTNYKIDFNQFTIFQNFKMPSK